MVDGARRGKIAAPGLNLLFFDVAAGCEILGRGLKGLHLLGHLIVDNISAGVHQSIIEPVVEPFLVHGAEAGVVMQNKPSLDVGLVCRDAD